jgi:hypothetical protein
VAGFHEMLSSDYTNNDYGRDIFLQDINRVNSTLDALGINRLGDLLTGHIHEAEKTLAVCGIFDSGLRSLSLRKVEIWIIVTRLDYDLRSSRMSVSNFHPKRRNGSSNVRVYNRIKNVLQRRTGISILPIRKLCTH